MGKVPDVYHCDVCKALNPRLAQQIQVIFTTDQTEGRSVVPYLSLQTIDICEDCMSYVLSGRYLFAHGAMGFNTYRKRELQ